MTWFPNRSSKRRLSHAGGSARRGQTRFHPQASELEGRTLLSTLTVANDDASGPGSLAGEIAFASSGDTIKFAHGLCTTRFAFHRR